MEGGSEKTCSLSKRGVDLRFTEECRAKKNNGAAKNTRPKTKRDSWKIFFPSQIGEQNKYSERARATGLDVFLAKMGVVPTAAISHVALIVVFFGKKFAPVPTVRPTLRAIHVMMPDA